MKSFSSTPIYFFYPPGLNAEAVSEMSGAFSPNRPGNYIWTVKTYAELERHGFACRLTDRLPQEGIVITHRDFLPSGLKPSDTQLFVCVVADCFRHPFAQLHVVQNPRDPTLVSGPNQWNAHFIPHWPETGLIPRDAARGDTFVNVSYFGLRDRLAPQLRSDRFADRMSREGFSFRIVARNKWNDYSDTDAVLAVRSFARVSFDRFPATKLYNSWLARVPALLGRESAYRAERRGEYDYFEVHDADHVLRVLIRLRDDRALRLAIARNCAARAAEIAPARVAEKWIDFLTNVALPAYEGWLRANASRRRAFYASRQARYVGFRCMDVTTRAIDFARKQARGSLAV